MAKEVVEKTITKTVTKQMPIENQSFIKKSSQVKKSFPKKKIAPSPRIVRHTSGLANASTIDKALIENFVGLQKVMTNLTIKFDGLSDKISKLLDVFEISAKSLAEKDFKDFIKVNDKEILEKLDNLLEQNKVIAKGLIMIHDKTNSFPQNIDVPIRMRSQSREYKTLVPMAMPVLPSPSEMGKRKKIITDTEVETEEDIPSSQDMGEYKKSIAPPREG